MDNKNLRVLVVSSKYPPEYSGSGLRAHNTYKRLMSKFNIKFDVITSSITSNKKGKYVLDGIEVKVISNKINKKMKVGDSGSILKQLTNRLFLLRDYWMEALPVFYYLYLNHSRYDLIHVFGNVNVTSTAITFAKVTKKPIAIELVNWAGDLSYPEPKLISLIFGQGFPKHALLVCISEYLMKMCRKYNCLDEQIWLRPNPVNENKFFCDRDRKQEYRKSIGQFHSSDTVLLLLAKFIPRKKQDFAVETMLYLPSDYKLLLVGPLVNAGPLFERDQNHYNRIIDLIHSNKLQERVKIMPNFVENPEDYIKAADVFLMPVIEEGLGTPFLEALACGVPVVSNDIPGVFDQWIKNGINGFINKLEHKEWADKIVSAAKINVDMMKKSSEEVLKAASTEIIDQRYYQRLKSIVGK